MQEVLTLANLLTLLRMLLIVPLIYLLWTGGSPWGAALLFGVAAITDVLDGYVARRRNETTMLGQLLDPIVDKALVIAIFIVYVLQGVIPITWLILLAGKEMMLLLGGALLLQSGRTVVPARFLGKAATAILLVGIAGLIVGYEEVGRWIVGGGVIVSLAAGVDYVRVSLLRP